MQPWERVVEAEHAYSAARRRMYEAGVERQLRLAFRDPHGRAMALGVLRDSTTETQMAFLPEMFDIATHLHGDLERAREIIGTLDAGWLFMSLGPLIAARLDAPDADYEDYLRIAEALQQWDQLAHLDALVARARQSSDPDILEVADDFQRYDLSGRPIEG